MQKMFRDKSGRVKRMISVFEGFSYRENPFDFFVRLARYKFAARLLKKNDRVLDAGCGLPFGTIFLSQFAAKITGGDFDEDLIADAQKEYADIPNVNFSALNLLDLSTHRKTYDAVVSMDVIEHFSKKNTEVVAANYAKLTAPKGFAVIGTPNIVSQPFAGKIRRASHLHEFNPDELQTLLERHFKRVFMFSMTDEVVSTSFSKLAWYLMAVCVK